MIEAFKGLETQDAEPGFLTIDHTNLSVPYRINANLDFVKIYRRAGNPLALSLYQYTGSAFLASVRHIDIMQV